MKHLHEATHYGRDLLTTYVKPWLTGPIISKALWKVIARNVVCQNNPQTDPRQRRERKQYQGQCPLKDLRTLLRCQGSKSGDICSLCRHLFPGWIEAYPTRTEKSLEAVKALLKEIIPHFGLPGSIQSDNRPAFISEITQEVSKF